MRYTVALLFTLIYINTASPREKAEIGLFGGTSYYIGDINTSLPFYRSSPAGGAMIKYNFNEHYAIKTGINFGSIKAYDVDFSNILHQTRQAEFVNNFYDLAIQGEFNFKPFKVTIFSRPFSTYVTAGLAYTFFPETGGPALSYLNFPFGGGIKYGVSKRVTVGMEWIVKKSISDNIDGVKNFGQFSSPSLVHNNDWVSLAGFFISIKPFDRKGDCPAYWN